MNNASQVSKEEKEHGFMERQAMRMARWPRTHFWVAFAISFGLSVIGMWVGEFSVSVEGSGWQSRGTLIADRQTQALFFTINDYELFSGGDEVWDDYINNVQPGWESDDDDDSRRRLIEKVSLREMPEASTLAEAFRPKPGPQLMLQEHKERVASTMMGHHDHSPARSFLARRLEDIQASNVSSIFGDFGSCDVSFYLDGQLFDDSRLWPVWKTKSSSKTFLQADVLEELCLEEEVTQRVLEENGLCFGCDDGTCLPPYSVVLYARLAVTDGITMDCASLAAAWGPFQESTEAAWKTCVEDLESGASSSDGGLPESCPLTFSPAFVDELFVSTDRVAYTSSVFATREDDVDELYELVGDFGKGSDLVEAAYDTQNEDFGMLFADETLGTDMALALGSAFITGIAIIVHTKSCFLTAVGLLQIMLSFPLAYFAYTLLGGLNFFPFLNFIGVFVVFALGADHVFVAVDKWKNARLRSPYASTEEIAAEALPDAASAMFLTTSTTAVAFFGTAICPVAPVKLFAIFCGLLIFFDYVMDVFLVFPSLCMYDRARGNSGCCMSCQKSNHTTEDERPGGIGGDNEHVNEDEDSGATKVSMIRHMLTSYYDVLHQFRWALLAACAVALAVCCYYASTLSLPTSSDVRIFTSKIEYERNYLYRQKLLFKALEKKDGSTATVMWGTTPADTGDHNDPATWSQLVLDDTFNPATQEAQTYLKEFCSRFFENDFADLTEPDFECAINRFDTWLQEQSSSDSPDSIYSSNCAGASGLPMSSDAFDSCIIAWSQQEGEMTILPYEGRVRIMTFRFSSRVRYDSPNSELDDEWKLIEDWMDQDSKDNAPAEAANRFFSSEDFWWYDTNTRMFQTATGSAGIAILAAALIILISSRSIVMTIFSILSVGYVLVSVTSTMVAIGWTLGFLESICFAILIGVSVDFVIHFSHAYVSPRGAVDRSVRTKHALIEMGPSILAAAFTTIAGAAIMLFCVITFFQKFALVLFLTIVQSTLGSFVFFLTLTDCIGPAEPTKVVDQCISKLSGSDDMALTQEEEPKQKEVKSIESDDIDVEDISIPDEEIGM